MISDKKTTQFILKHLSNKERDIYANFLALPDSVRRKIIEDGEAGRVLPEKYVDMYSIYSKVKQLQCKLISIA